MKAHSVIDQGRLLESAYELLNSERTSAYEFKMRHLRRGFLILGGSLALTACASGAAVNPQTTPTAIAVSGTPTVVTRNVPAPATGSIATANAPMTTSSKRALNAGPSDARRVVRNGVVVYCEMETVTGSHAEKAENCFTATQWEQIAERSQLLLEQVQSQSALHPNVPQMGGALAP